MKHFILILFLASCYFGYSQEVILNQEKLDSLSNSKNDEVPLNQIIKVITSFPIYEGCNKESSYAAQKKCFQQKIALHFRDNFNTEMHEKSDIEPGIKRIYANFKIDTSGAIIDINPKAPDQYLKEEVVRVVKLIPQLTPGYHKGKPTIIPFSIPLVIEIKPNKNNGLTSFPLYVGCEKDSLYTNQKKCFYEKINELYENEFNTQINKNSDLQPGKQRFYLEFNVDTEGNITDVMIDAEDEYISAEAKRVAKLIPNLTPGLKKGKAAAYNYSKIISVNMTSYVEEDKTRFPVYKGCQKESNNTDLEACSKEKIMNFIKMSFDIEMASRALPTEKSTQFLLEFIINKKGKVENVNAKANHKAIAIEAINVAKRLPKFKAPGLLNGIAVDTPFSMLMTIDFY